MEHVVSEEGRNVPELMIRPNMFMDHTSVLYGATGTGKTVIVKQIMHSLEAHIEQILVISPTEPTNRSYEGFVDSTLIHYRLGSLDPTDKKDTEAKASLRFLETIYKRQEMMASIFKRASKPEVLSKLYKRLSHAERKEGDMRLASLKRKRQRVVENLRRQYSRQPAEYEEKIKDIEEKLTKMLILLYKKFLTPNVGYLWDKKDISEDERYTLHYLHFNPRILLIFDDCAANLKPFFNKDIFRMIFYQGRHSFITAIICCQDDTDIPTNLRKNVFISFFCEEVVCTSNFDRVTNKFPKRIKDEAKDIAPTVFVGHRKLAYIREDPKRQHFYHVTCKKYRPKLFGSGALQELCNELRSDEMKMDETNPFYDRFKV